MPRPPRIAVILNPTAGGGRAARRAAGIAAAFESAGCAALVLKTERPGHATELARAERSRADLVVAAGGDGTVHEVVRGLAGGTGDAPPLGLLPIGTGNDFASLFALSKTLPEAARALLDPAKDTRIDLGEVTWRDAAGTHTRAFCNAVGMGFDAAVAIAAARMKHLPGVLGYLAAVRRTLGAWQSPVAHIHGESVPGEPAPRFLLTVGNGRRSGGGFYLTPRADLTDGLLDVCAVRDVGVARALQLLPGVLLGGRHEGQPEVTTARVREIAADFEPPVPLHADGEILSHAAEHVAVRIRPEALRVRARLR